jgi:hypothetical protein
MLLLENCISPPPTTLLDKIKNAMLIQAMTDENKSKIPVFDTQGRFSFHDTFEAARAASVKGLPSSIALFVSKEIKSYSSFNYTDKPKVISANIEGPGQDKASLFQAALRHEIQLILPHESMYKNTALGKKYLNRLQHICKDTQSANWMADFNQTINQALKNKKLPEDFLTIIHKVKTEFDLKTNEPFKEVMATDLLRFSLN